MTVDLSTLFLLPVYANLFTARYVLLLESEKISKTRGPSASLPARPLNTLLDERGRVGTLHHEGEHLGAGTHGPLVGGRRDSRGSGEALGPALLHGCWLDAGVEGHLRR